MKQENAENKENNTNKESDQSEYSFTGFSGFSNTNSIAIPGLDLVDVDGKHGVGIKDHASNSAVNGEFNSVKEVNVEKVNNSPNGYTSNNENDQAKVTEKKDNASGSILGGDVAMETDSVDHLEKKQKDTEEEGVHIVQRTNDLDGDNLSPHLALGMDASLEEGGDSADDKFNLADRIASFAKASEMLHSIAKMAQVDSELNMDEDYRSESDTEVRYGVIVNTADTVLHILQPFIT